MFDVTPRPNVANVDRKGSLAMPGSGSKPPAPEATAAVLPMKQSRRGSDRDGSGTSDASSAELSDTGEMMESEVFSRSSWLPSLLLTVA